MFACEGEYKIRETDTALGSDGGDTEDTTPEEDYSEFDGASLVIHEPASGDFLPYGETASFSAEVIGADGNTLDFDDIVWTSDIDDAWTLTGRDLSDDSLDVGTHALTAEASLPNGDRLAYTIGGVLVQSAYTGVYTGTLTVDVAADYNGTTYAAGCSGAITLVVDVYGETATGDAGCLISLFGYDLDTTYVFDLENDDGSLSGTAGLDLSFYTLDIDTTGDISDDGVATLSFATDIYGYGDLTGEVEATRVSRDVSEYE
jgi:hypothetical protein